LPLTAAPTAEVPPSSEPPPVKPMLFTPYWNTKSVVRCRKFDEAPLRQPAEDSRTTIGSPPGTCITICV